MIKPMLLSDTIISKIQYPVYLQPKADGCRALVQGNIVYPRSLKKFANKHTQAYFSREKFNGFDMEIYVGNITDQDLCRNTTSAVNSIEGVPPLKAMVFDLVNLDYRYEVRLMMLERRVKDLGLSNITVAETTVCYDEQHLLDLEGKYLNMGYEGVVVRTMDGWYKEGRVNKSNPVCTRIKRFMDAEAIVVELIEAEENLNEKQTNELGLSFRTSHQENKTGKGILGSMICRTAEGETIKVGAGAMNHTEREYYWENQGELVGKLIKYKCFPKGVKDKPRFPTFLSVRADFDI